MASLKLQTKEAKKAPKWAGIMRSEVLAKRRRGYKKGRRGRVLYSNSSRSSRVGREVRAPKAWRTSSQIDSITLPRVTVCIKI